MNKLRVGLLFGGCSGEHEVSISSARAIAKALTTDENTTRYELLPVYIQKNGVWKDSTIAQQVLESGKPLLIDDEAQPGDRIPQNINLSEIDLWFPILHGPNGEDGTIQGLLTLMQVPFVGFWGFGFGNWHG